MRLEPMEHPEERKHPSFLSDEEKLFGSEQPIEEKEARSAVFDSFVFQHLMKSIEQDFEYAGFDEEDIQAIEKSFVGLSNEEARRALSIPFEMRPRLFGEFRKKIDDGEMETGDIALKLIERGEKTKSTIGFHISPSVIAKKRQPDGSMSWSIEGYEVDDRDDMKMAYYSLDYGNLYRKKRGSNLYLIRAITNENLGHKRDQSNNWGRSTKLSVIDSINLREADAHVDDIISKLKERGLIKKKQEPPILS